MAFNGVPPVYVRTHDSNHLLSVVSTVVLVALVGAIVCLFVYVVHLPA